MKLADITPQTKSAKSGGCSCLDDDAWFGYASGTNKRRYPVRICTSCGRMILTAGPQAQHLAADEVTKTSFKKSLQPVNIIRTRLPFRVLAKAVAKSCFHDPKSCGLRWITAHPHGDETDGIPLLVHDNGEEYAVVGGAGGRLNQTVFRKPQGAKERETAGRVNREKLRREKLEAEPEWVKQQAEAAKTIRTEAAEKRNLLGEHIKTLFGDPTMSQPFAELETQIRRQARAKAEGLSTSISEEEKKRFEDTAVGQAKSEQRELLNKATNGLLDAAARKALGEEVGNQIELTAKSGKKVTLRLAPEAIEEAAKKLYEIDQLQRSARAIEKAIDAGDHETLAGLEARMKDHDPTPEQVEQWVTDGYLESKNVDAQTNLVMESERSPAFTKSRQTANGVADGINNFLAGISGEAILTPESVRQLGPENAARVAAVYLRGKTGEEATAATAGGLRDRIAKDSYASATAALESIYGMTEIAESATKAAESGDGTLSKGQAAIIRMNMGMQRGRIANIARGQLRAAAAMAHWMETPPDHPDNHTAMSIAGGANDVEAHARAQGMGLDESDYSVDKAEGGGRNILIKSDSISKIANPHALADHQANMEMERLRDDVAEHPGEWHPEGLSPNILLQPHQELAARAIVQNKRIVLNYGAGSGKTSVAYAAAADLLSSGKATKGVISMPAKPRSQQEDYVDPDGGEKKTGEKKKFLTPEMSDRFTVVEDSADLKKKLGKYDVLIMSPQLVRERAADLEKAGFTGPKTFYFADEAHELAAGIQDKPAKRKTDGKPEDVRTEETTVQAEHGDSVGVQGTAVETSSGSSATKAKDAVDEGRGIETAGHDGGAPSAETPTGTPEQEQSEIRGSGMSQAFQRMMGGVEYGVGMSGSLIENNASELHSILKAVHGSHDDASKKAFQDQMGSAERFNDRWQRVAQTSGGLFSKEAVGALRSQLGSKMLSYHGKPTRKGKTGQDEPVELHEHTEIVHATDADRKKLEVANEKYGRDKIATDPDVRKSAALARETAVRNALNLSEAKQDRIADMIKAAKLKNPDHKTIIHCSTLEPLRRLRKRLESAGHKVQRITGAEDDRQVAAALKGFNKGDTDCLIVSDAGNYGINAQAGDYVVMMHPPSTPSKYRQLMKRAHRIGRVGDVHAYIVRTDTPQEQIAEHRMKQQKGKQMDLLEQIADDEGFSQTISRHREALSKEAVK